MSITREEIEDTVYAVINARAGERVVVFAQQNAPRPSEPYISIDTPRLVRESKPDETYIPYDAATRLVTKNVRLHYAVYVDVVFFKARGAVSPHTDADILQRRLYRDNEDFPFSPLAFITSDEVLDTSLSIDTQIEPRAQFTLRLRVAVDEPIDIPTIEAVNKVGSFLNP